MEEITREDLEKLSVEELVDVNMKLIELENKADELLESIDDFEEDDE